MILYVDQKHGSDDNDGTRESPLRTVQVAIDRAPEGGEVRIRPGRYIEFLSLNKTVNIRGSWEDEQTT